MHFGQRNEEEKEGGKDMRKKYDRKEKTGEKLNHSIS